MFNYKKKSYEKVFKYDAVTYSYVLTFSACSSDDDETTYTVVFNAYQGISTTLRIFECNDNGEKIGNNSIQLKTGEQQTFTASSSTSKVKIYISRESTMGNTNKWVQQVFLLNKGENTTITIDDKTIVGPNEP